MSIPAEFVKKLREMSGAPMMECKKALEEAGGDTEAAFTILRKRGQAAAAMSREAGVSPEGEVFTEAGAAPGGELPATVVAAEEVADGRVRVPKNPRRTREGKGRSHKGTGSENGFEPESA